MKWHTIKNTVHMWYSSQECSTDTGKQVKWLLKAFSSGNIVEIMSALKNCGTVMNCMNI